MKQKESKEFKLIKSVLSKKIRKNQAGLEDIIKMKKSGTLDEYCSEMGINNAFKKMLNRFINTLNNKGLNNYPVYKKYCLYTESDFIACFQKFGFFFNFLFDDNAEARNNIKRKFSFALFFRNACKKYQIEPYASMDIEKLDHILTKNIDIIHQSNFGYMTTDEEICNSTVNYVNSDTIYNQYFDPKSRSQIDSRSKACIKAEELSSQTLRNGKTIWLARYGNSYACDILNIVFDKKNTHETVIEVKTISKKNNFIFMLSRREYALMRKIADLPSSEYFIHVYKYSNSGECLLSHKPVIYKYNNENNTLVDINDSENIYIIEPTFEPISTVKNNYNARVNFICTPAKLENNKKLILSSNE